MVKIKEIKKIESKVKEIKKEKVESLDDELNEESEEIYDENFVSNNGLRRFNKTSTLAATEAPQTSEIRERRIPKEDEQEVNFRPSYTGGGNPYQNKSYTPVGAAESTAVRDNRQAERSFENRADLQRSQQEQMQNQNQMSGGERRGEAEYAGEREQEKKDRRRNMM